jgi:hypothetical protein
MKRTFVFFAVLLVVSATAFAQNPSELNDKHYFPPQGAARPGGGSGQNLVYHSGGTVIISAHVVDIFWGPSFATNGSNDNSYAKSLQAYRNNFGGTGEYAVITQYYQNLGSGNQFIQPANLAGGTSDWFDASTPPTNVTDADVQAEVQRYFNSGHAYNASTIYEVFIPSGSYSSSGSSTSCGGPNLAYCAYHGHFKNAAGQDTKYSIQPWAGCSGCSSFSNPLLDQEHFVCHETREAVTDQDLNAWFDRRGNEADDKCAWSPAPFLDGGSAYQYEWSNAVGGCVQKQ